MERCKLPSGGPGRRPGRKHILVYFEVVQYESLSSYIGWFCKYPKKKQLRRQEVSERRSTFKKIAEGRFGAFLLNLSTDPKSHFTHELRFTKTFSVLSLDVLCV